MISYFNEIKEYVIKNSLSNSNDSDNEITIKTDDDTIFIDGETREISDSKEIFNIKAIQNGFINRKEVFIVKDVIDALCLLTNGYEAMSIKNLKKETLKIIFEENAELIEKENFKKIVFDYSLVVGNKSIKELKKIESLLLDSNIRFCIFDFIGKYKNINDFIEADKTTFLKRVNNIDYKISNNLTAGIKDIEKKKVADSFDNSHIDLYLSELRQAEPYIPTGFKHLDELLDGGLYEGLYTIGAIPSLGKTTFMLQIADYIAGQGRCVLFFSLEMSRMELMLKTLSRHTYLITENNDKFTSKNAMTTNKIRQLLRKEKEYPNDFEVLCRAIDKYKEYAKNKRIIERTKKIGIGDIKKEIENTIKITGKTPIVIIDYLQALAPENDRNTEKQNVDIAMTELKAISRDYRTTVFIISSLNRSNYKTSISFEAFKESGSVEYASDVVLGLQYIKASELTGDELDIETESRGKNDTSIRDIELVFLKNRNGAIGKSINYKYYASFNYFESLKIKDKKKSP